MKYIFLKDYHARGNNIIPSGSNIASVLVEYDFKKGDIIDGELTSFQPNLRLSDAVNATLKTRFVPQLLLTDQAIGVFILPVQNDIVAINTDANPTPQNAGDVNSPENAKKRYNQGMNRNKLRAIGIVGAGVGTGYLIGRKKDWKVASMIIGGIVFLSGALALNAISGFDSAPPTTLEFLGFGTYKAPKGPM